MTSSTDTIGPTRETRHFPLLGTPDFDLATDPRMTSCGLAPEVGPASALSKTISDFRRQLDNLESVRCDRELSSVISVFVSATNVFMSVDQEKLRSALPEKYGPYVDYIQNADAPLPEKINGNNHVLLCSTGRAVV